MKGVGKKTVCDANGDCQRICADVLRYLSGEAVQAHPPNSPTACESSFDANQGRVIAVSMILLALLGGLTGTAWGLMEARRSAEFGAGRQDRRAGRRDAERAAKLDAQEKEKLARRPQKASGRAAAGRRAERKFAEAISRFVQDDFLALTSVRGPGALRRRRQGSAQQGHHPTATPGSRGRRRCRRGKTLTPSSAELCLIVGQLTAAPGTPEEGSRVHGARRPPPRAYTRPGPLRHTPTS